MLQTRPRQAIVDILFAPMSKCHREIWFWPVRSTKITIRSRSSPGGEPAREWTVGMVERDDDVGGVAAHQRGSPGGLVVPAEPIRRAQPACARRRGPASRAVRLEPPRAVRSCRSDPERSLHDHPCCPLWPLGLRGTSCLTVDVAAGPSGGSRRATSLRLVWKLEAGPG